MLLLGVATSARIAADSCSIQLPGQSEILYSRASNALLMTQLHEHKLNSAEPLLLLHTGHASHALAAPRHSGGDICSARYRE